MPPTVQMLVSPNFSPAAADLPGTSQPMSEKPKIVGLEGWKGAGRATQRELASNGKLAGSVLSSASKVVWTAGVTPGLRVSQGRWGHGLPGQMSQVSCSEIPTD